MDHRDQDETQHRDTWRWHLSWPALLLAGWLLYEFTAQPGLAALVACAKFGWTDMRTAFWLRRVDPDRLRGRTCCWWYLTYGLWKVAVMATVTMIAIGFGSVILDRLPRQPAGNNGLSPVLAGVLTAAALGFGLAILTTWIALFSAVRNGVRIWLGHAPHRARKERFWPPRHGRINAAPFVFFTMSFITVWVVVLLFAGLMGIGGRVWEPFIILGVLVSIAMLVMILLFLFKRSPGEYGAPWLVARSPRECWGTEEDEEVYQAPTAEESMSGA